MEIGNELMHSVFSHEVIGFDILGYRVSISNSTVILWLVIIVMILLARWLTKGLTYVPQTKKQNMAEIIVGGAVVFVMTISSAVTWLVNEFLLKKLQLEYLQTIAFILVIASLVQFVEIILKKFLPPLYKALGIYLPLITTNCAVLGAALINISREYTFVNSIFYGFGAGLGFTLALVLFSGVREKLESCDVPQSFKGLPISLIAAALVSVAFFGFQGLFG